MPSQKRSRETVAVIYQAAAHVFSTNGYANTTTDHIAERAGVSIGTLYQYFPSKEAISLGLWEKHIKDQGRCSKNISGYAAEGFNRPEQCAIFDSYDSGT